MRAPEAFPEGAFAADGSPIPSAGRARPVRSFTRLDSLRASRALFLLAAGVSFLLSVYLWFLVDREQGLFVGLWVPSILSLGALLSCGRK